jgi:hypothetical protein
MLETITTPKITLKELEKKFELKLVTDPDFFTEYRENLPAITELQKQLLDKLKTGYLRWVEHQNFPEKSLTKAVIAPLLFIGGFYNSPCDYKKEKKTDFLTKNDGKMVDNNIDTLVLKNKVWVTAIECQETSFCLETGLPGILASMLANGDLKQPNFGMITTGASFIFLKLVHGKSSKYALFTEFSLANSDNDLYQVLSILKALSIRS